MEERRKRREWMNREELRGKKGKRKKRRGDDGKGEQEEEKEEMDEDFECNECSCKMKGGGVMREIGNGVKSEANVKCMITGNEGVENKEEQVVFSWQEVRGDETITSELRSR